MHEHAVAEVAIRALLAACTQAGDARKAERYAECFAEDGVLELGEVIRGRAAIREWMAAPSVIPQPSSGAPGYVSHHLTTCAITFTGADAGVSEAKARTYWLVTSAAGLDHNGYYDDLLRRDGDEWLIVHRRPRTLWVSPSSVLHTR